MKRILSFLIALTMCISMIPAAFAAEMSFTDVKETDWFYNDVKTAVESGLVNGKSPTTFAPNDNLTYAETFKLAACMNQLYNEGVVTLTGGNPWYKPYVDYCRENNIGKNIMSHAEQNMSAQVKREAYMAVFADALPDEGLKAINNVPDGSIPDVPSNHSLAPSIYKLYRAGILQGVDKAHNCNPDANITRAEVAAILTRMMDESKRVTIDDMGTGEQKPDDTKQEEQNPEDTKQEETKTENTETENTENNKSTGGAKDKFQQAETTEDAEDKGFLMYAEDVFYVTDKGVLVNGRIIKGELKVGDAIKIISADGSETAASVARIEMFRKSLNEAKKGDNIGLLLNPEIAKGTVVKGDTLIGADADYTVTNTLIGTLTLLSTAEGGRESAISNSFSPQFSYGSHDTTGVITGLANGTMNPGETQENINVKFSAQKGVWYAGQTLDVLQAGRKLGTFTVTMIGSSSSRPSTTRPSTTRPSTSTTLAYKTQPVSTTVNADEYATFTVEVTGGKAPYQYYWMAAPAVGRGQEYQWEYLGEDKVGAEFIWSTSSNTLKVRPNKAGIVYYHSVVIDANGDSIVSNNVYLTAKAGDLHVEITGKMTTDDIMAITANAYGGSGKYAYQWQSAAKPNSEDNWHNATKHLMESQKNTEQTCYFDFDQKFGSVDNMCVRVCVTDLETGKTAYSSYVRGNALLGKDAFTISETKGIAVIKDSDKLAFEKGKEKTVELEVFGGKAPYTYRWEYSTDGTNFKSIPVEATWADSVAKYNLKVTYDGVGIIKGNYIRCKVTDANGTVFYSDPLKIIEHIDLT